MVAHMYSSQLDFFPDGIAANGDRAFGFEIGSLIRVPAAFQVWVQDTTTPTFTLKLYSRVRKERVTDAAYAPPWVERATITNATAAADRLVSVTVRSDEWKVVVSSYSGTGRVFAVLSGENIGGQR
jgi:hypothetical protein